MLSTSDLSSHTSNLEDTSHNFLSQPTFNPFKVPWPLTPKHTMSLVFLILVIVFQTTLLSLLSSFSCSYFSLIRFILYIWATEVLLKHKSNPVPSQNIMIHRFPFDLGIPCEFYHGLQKPMWFSPGYLPTHVHALTLLTPSSHTEPLPLKAFAHAAPLAGTLST